MLRNSYSFEALKFSTRTDSVPLFMAQLESEKADLSKETAGFSYQNLISIGKLETKVLLNWNINIQFLNRKFIPVLINLYFYDSPFLFQESD